MTNRSSHLIRNRKSSLQLEKLENRQLLATIVYGEGEEVGTDIEFQGNIYDQILMTGISVTVEADPGQIVRISYQDENFDILQTEFSGAGQLSVFLTNFTGPADPTNINQPGVQYVTGTPSFTIQESDLSSNFTLSTVGPVTSPIWETLVVDGVEYDGVADAQRLMIIANPLDPGGSVFGGIRMANSLLSGNTGTVGISAINVSVQNEVIIGDIEASDTGIPTLNFSNNSQFGTLQVAGGDLTQPNNIKIFGGVNAGVDSLNFISGTDSQGNILPAQMDNSPGWIDKTPPAESIDNRVDPIDITGLTQAELDAIFLGRTFTNDIIIEGDFLQEFTIQSNEFRGDLTFRGTEESTGIFDGPVNITDGIDGDLIFQGVAPDSENPGANDLTVASNISIGGALVGDLIFGATSGVDAVNYSGDFSATSSGKIWVFGDFSGEFSTDSILSNGFFTEGEGAIGDINVSGNYSGRTLGILGIGNIAIEGNLTTTSSNGATAFYTSSGGIGDSFLANIGTLTVDGDVDQADNADKLIDINQNGNFGAINIKGGGSLGNTISNFLAIGDIDTGGTLGGDDITGTVTIADSSSDIEILGVSINSGTLGAISIMGPGTANTDLRITGAIGGINAMVSDISVSGFQIIQENASIFGSSVGNVSFTTNTPTATNNTLIDLNSFIDSSGDVGTVELNAGTSDSVVDVDGVLIDADNGNGDIGSIQITGATVDLDNGGGTLFNANNVGPITIIGTTSIAGDFNAGTFSSVRIDGATTFGNGAGFQSTVSLDSLEITGATIFDTTGGNPNISVTDSGTLTFGSVDFATNGGSSPAILADDGTSERDIIGGIVINGQVFGNPGKVDIQASAIGDITISPSLTAAGQAVVTDFNVVAIPNTDVTAGSGETVLADGTDLGNYAIGNITVTNTNTSGITGTVLFDTTTAGAGNSFIALGAIGNISLTAGGSENVQTGLFSLATDSALFIVGDTTGDPGGLVAGLTIDLDGTTGTAETYTQLTGGTVSIGNVLIDVASISPSSNADTVVLANGEAAGTTNFTGLNILSGVTAPHGDMQNAIDDIGGNKALAEVNEIMIRNNAVVAGTVGTVSIVNKTQQLTTETMVASVTASVTTLANSDSFGAIVAATDVGAVNGAGDPAATLNAVVVGRNGGASNNVLTTGEYLVYIV
jgi:hypothetical protein